MLTTLLKAKLHRACVTHAELNYEGSCAIDGGLLDRSGIHEYEQIHVYNLSNGERFVTYAIRAANQSGVISMNGAAARKATPGDLVIICAYGMFSPEELVSYRPTMIYVDQHNRIIRTGHSIPIQNA